MQRVQQVRARALQRAADVRPGRRRRALSASSCPGAAAARCSRARRGQDRAHRHRLSRRPAHFTTDNVNVPGESIVVDAEGRPVPPPARRMAFRALAADACKVEFDARLRVRDRPCWKPLVGPVFNHIARHVHRRVRAARRSASTRNDAMTPARDRRLRGARRRGDRRRSTAARRARPWPMRSRRADCVDRLGAADAVSLRIHGQRARPTPRSPTATGSSSRGRCVADAKSIRRARAAG